jgi:hypothetical protein
MIAEKLRKIVNEALANKLEALIVGIFGAIFTLALLRIPAVQAEEWYVDVIDFIAKALTTFGVGAFIVYLIVDLLLDEQRSPANLLIEQKGKAHNDSKQFVRTDDVSSAVSPYQVFYKLKDESNLDFLKRATNALKSSSVKCCIVVFYSEPYCIIKFADGAMARMIRGEAPWESGQLNVDLSTQTYEDYMSYVSQFVNGFRTHLKRCAFESPDIDDIDILSGAMLPSFMPKGFGVKRALSFIIAFVLSISSLLSQSAASQIYDMMRGGVREVPDKGSVVEFVFDNGAVIVRADGRRTYEMLMKSVKRQLSKYNDNTLMGIFVDGKELVSRRVVNDIVNERQEAVRVKPVSSPQTQTQSVRPPVVVAPSTPPPVDVRPEPPTNAPVQLIRPPADLSVNTSPNRAMEQIDSIKNDAENFFSSWWAVVEYAFHAFGRFLVFLMILSRMLASQAAGEMVATFAGRVWGGQVLLSSLVFLSTWQMVLVWLASGYLLTAFSIFLANTGVNFFWWFTMTVGASLLLIRLSRWFVVSPRDVLDAQSGRGGGVIPRG